MNVKRLEFVLTEKCNSRCDHCQGAHSPERQGVMKTRDGVRYLEETISVAELSSFMIFGGESMLYSERTIQLFQRASDLEIPTIELITNGYWGKNPEKARYLATKLKEAGVTDVLVSVDSFHLPHIPLEAPTNAARVCKEAGLRVCWNVAVLGGIEASNKYDKRTREVIQFLEPLDIEAHYNEIWPHGRALNNLHEYFPRKSLEGECPEKYTTLVNPNCISMDPAGWASICWDMTIGNAKETPLTNLITNYDWKRHPVIKTLVKKGPLGLLNLPESKGFDFRAERYIDKCHLCCDVRRFLQKTYPEMYTS
jgi:MoaA/NifB/PqqE/SkfB family radical SAM enzyme